MSKPTKPAVELESPISFSNVCYDNELNVLSGVISRIKELDSKEELERILDYIKNRFLDE